MCGRFVLKAPPAKLADYFDLDAWEEVVPRYNIPPGTAIAVIRQSPEQKRVLHRLRWGLVPHWAKDTGIGGKLNNARGETVAEKPAYRRRRCLIPADGFYEWGATDGKAKQPHYISQKSGEPLALAGLWEAWKAPDGEILRTCCIITTRPNAVMAPADWATWLVGPVEAAGMLIRPAPEEGMQAWAVSRRVSRPGADDSALIEPEETPLM